MSKDKIQYRTQFLKFYTTFTRNKLHKSSQETQDFTQLHTTFTNNFTTLYKTCQRPYTNKQI